MGYPRVSVRHLRLPMMSIEVEDKSRHVSLLLPAAKSAHHEVAETSSHSP